MRTGRLEHSFENLLAVLGRQHSEEGEASEWGGVSQMFDGEEKKESKQWKLKILQKQKRTTKSGNTLTPHPKVSIYLKIQLPFSNRRECF